IRLNVTEDFNIIERYSSLTKLKRVTAYCLRFCHNCRCQRVEKRYGLLNLDEIEEAFTKLLKICQDQHFKDETDRLKKNQSISKGSRLLSLTPFIGNDGLLRVGGRLTHADVPFNQRHPIILPSSHTLTTMIINYEHLKYLHGGIQSTLANLQQQTKWNTNHSQTALKPGALVTLKDDNLPPLQWKLGRIVQLHPGEDNVCRVASIQTGRSIQKVAVRKICVLPVPIDRTDTNKSD
ncbi:hypothetical protein PPYR_15709, partial [Photinus pyralis]